MNIYMWNHIALLCIALFMLGFIIYLIIMMRKLSKTTQEMRTHIPGKMYNTDTYEKLLQSAIRTLRTNINVVTQPGFYAKSVHEIICVLPEYKIVLHYAQYAVTNNVPQDVFESVMKDKYGEDYAHSPELTTQVKVPHVFYERSYEHSVLIDIKKAQLIYKDKKSDIDAILSASITQEETVRKSCRL